MLTDFAKTNKEMPNIKKINNLLPHVKEQTFWNYIQVGCVVV